jgi:uncharacterized membrane protein YfhO
LANIIDYTSDKVVLKTQNRGLGFLVLTDVIFPSWRAKVDGKETPVYTTDYTFRGIVVPKGVHIVEFYNSFFTL